MRKTAKPDDAAHIELLASIFATVAPAIIMSLLFTGVGAVAVARTGDPHVAVLYGAGLLATVGRLGVTFRYGGCFRNGLPSAAAARRLERVFGAALLLFSIVFGGFAARVVRLAVPGLDTAVVALVVGYAAGVATGVALRPRIGVPAMLCAVLPTMLVALCAGGIEGPTLAITLAGLLVGGIRSTLVRYHAALDGIASRHFSSSQARSDPLTGLPNRLALAEHLDAARASRAPAAICCIDLDDFKPINDRYGHAFGDAVLCEVAERLRTLVGTGDLASRVGGDEFVFVGRWAASEEGRHALARRVAIAMGQPYFVGGRWVSVGASVGVAALDPADDPDRAIARADHALYEAKRVRRERTVPHRLRQSA